MSTAAAVSDHIPPQSIETEQAVLASMFRMPQVIPEVRSTLSAADFYRQAHGQIFDAILAVHDLGKGIFTTTVQDEMSARKQLQSLPGGHQYLSQLFNMDLFPDNTLVVHEDASKYAGIVKEKSIFRRLEHFGRTIAAASTQPHQDIEKLLADLEREFSKLRDSSVSTSAKVLNIAGSDEEAGFLAWAEQKYEAKRNNQRLGPVSGIVQLDRRIGHFGTGLHVLHGQAGAGKTALAMQWAVENASDRCCALFVSTEMSVRVMQARLTAHCANVALKRIMYGDEEPETVRGMYAEVKRQAPSLAMMDATVYPVTAIRIQDAARKLKEDTNASHVFIVLDSLQTYADTLDGRDQYQRINQALQQCRAIASRLECAVLLISEENRSKENDGASKTLGSGKIEYGAETIFGLVREKDALPDEYDRIPIELKIEKNRGGAAHSKPVHLKFQGSKMRFFEDA